MLQLVRREGQLLGLLLNELAPRPIDLSYEAMELWRDFHDQVERRLSRADAGDAGIETLAAINDVASKAGENAIRIAGVLTMVQDPDAEEIDGETMSSAIKLMSWYLEEALRLQAVAKADPHLEDARKLHQFVLAQHGKRSTFTTIMNKGPGRLRLKNVAEPLIKTLREHGLLKKVKDKPLTYEAVEEPNGGGS